MSIFDKFKNLLTHKATSENSLERLLEKFAQSSEQLLSYDGIHKKTISMHLKAGEAACNRAFECLRLDDQNKAFKHTRCGLVHLHIATLHLSGKSPAKVELNVEIDTIEGALHELIEQIAKTKLIVEYGELLVSASAHESLLNVISIFDTTMADFQKNHIADARRGAGAGLVALRWTLNLLEQGNPGQNFSNLKSVDYPFSRYENRACELADRIIQSKVALDESMSNPEVAEYLQNAEEKFKSCLENLIEGDNQQIMLEVRAGLFDLQLAEAASKNSEDSSERRQNRVSRQAIAEFKQDVYRLLRLAEQLDVDNRSLEQRLTATENYFISAHKRLEANDLAEAERLGRAAHLDLDFSWQLVNACKKAEYKSDI